MNENKNMNPVTSAGVAPNMAAPQVADHRKSRLSTKLLLFTAVLIGLAVLALAMIAISLGAAALTDPATNVQVTIDNLRNQILLSALFIILMGGALGLCHGEKVLQTD